MSFLCEVRTFKFIYKNDLEWPIIFHFSCQLPCPEYLLSKQRQTPGFICNPSMSENFQCFAIRMNGPDANFAKKDGRVDIRMEGQGNYYISSSLTSFNFKLAMQKCLSKHGKVELKNCRQIFIIQVSLGNGSRRSEKKSEVINIAIIKIRHMIDLTIAL